MKLSADQTSRIKGHLREVTRCAQAAERAPDTCEAKRCLASLWSAVHDAYRAIDIAENELRSEAIARVEGPAA